MRKSSAASGPHATGQPGGVCSRAQYDEHKEEFKAAMDEVLQATCFINGPQVSSCDASRAVSGSPLNTANSATQIKDLEATLAAFVGVKHCIACDNGTSAIHMVLRAMDIGPGDEVITVPFTWISTVEAIVLAGATPVLVDVEAHSFNMNVSQVKAAITPKTKAIMPVSLFGQCADMAALAELSEESGIPIIEDAAQSFGATQGGKASGSLSRIATTSFFPAKPLGCFGDGGAVFTDDDELATNCVAIRNHGAVVRDTHTRLGFTGRLDSLQAAVLNVKMKHFPSAVEARGRIGARYSELLSGTAATPPQVVPGNTHVYAQYTVRVSNRDAVVAGLKARGIPCGVYYPTGCHLQPVFAEYGWAEGDFPVTEALGKEVLSLPMHPYLTEDVQDHIVQCLKEAMEEAAAEAPASAAAATAQG